MTPSRARIIMMMPLCLASASMRPRPPQCGAAAVMVPGPVMVLRARSPGGQRAGMGLCRHEIMPSRAAGVPAGPGPASSITAGKALGTVAAGSHHDSARLAVSRSAGLSLLEVSCAA